MLHPCPIWLRGLYPLGWIRGLLFPGGSGFSRRRQRGRQRSGEDQPPQESL